MGWKERKKNDNRFGDQPEHFVDFVCSLFLMDGNQDEFVAAKKKKKYSEKEKMRNGYGSG